ncbi:TIR domain-containing protein [Sphingomonas sp. AOB5]|uniref:TIR domain-containing protein n=1 Tax=Sphingomonas sp. AOB5 TaxID=3034017 RepID=UPI0023F9CE55|nr:TIR domain-containing protein [Sphingomonas sp. AOB5]MDF7774119.1 TIR domain-containing protein [Sphingomonas sp. AOB5]
MYELQQQYGRQKVNVFQDLAAISAGDDWKQQIVAALENATFLIPILTPSFLESEHCCEEVALFLEREARLNAQYPELNGRRRIFPILYVSVDQIDAFDPRIAAELGRVQWMDFTRLRFKPDDGEQVRLSIFEFAESICKLLQVRVPPPEEVAERDRKEANRKRAETVARELERLKTEAKAKAEAQEKVRLAAEAKAAEAARERARAKALAEEEAKARAKAEARAKAAEEAKARAAAEAKARAEAEAKALAETKARLAAAEKAKTEAAAKLRAEAEAAAKAKAAAERDEHLAELRARWYPNSVKQPVPLKTVPDTRPAPVSKILTKPAQPIAAPDLSPGGSSRPRAKAGASGKAITPACEAIWPPPSPPAPAPAKDNPTPAKAAPEPDKPMSCLMQVVVGFLVIFVLVATLRGCLPSGAPSTGNDTAVQKAGDDGAPRTADETSLLQMIREADETKTKSIAAAAEGRLAAEQADQAATRAKAGQAGYGHQAGSTTDNSKYEEYGRMTNGKLNGYGVRTWTKGEVVRGTFKDGKIDGYATITFPDGERYEGNIVDDKFSGYGIVYSRDGNKFHCLRQNNLANGSCYNSIGNEFFKGRYKNGKLDGPGISFEESGAASTSAIYEQEKFVRAVNYRP